MLRTDVPDHRRSDDAVLVAALRARDPLALAEAYHRTVPAAHAVARRLLSGSTDTEALLRSVYERLWSDPPEADQPLEGWVRELAFTLAAAHLRERQDAPNAPSAAELLPDLPAPTARYLDAAERALAELAEEERRALLLAHDRGVSSSEQDEPGAADALERALLALAGPEVGAADKAAAEDPCDDVEGLADLALGLLPPAQAAALEAAAGQRPGCGARLRALRRGRRKLEGLPPTPDLGQRVLVLVLAGAPAPAPAVRGTAPAAAAGGASVVVEVDEDEPTEDLAPVTAAVRPDQQAEPSVQPDDDPWGEGWQDPGAVEPGTPPAAAAATAEQGAWDEADDPWHAEAGAGPAAAAADVGPGADGREGLEGDWDAGQAGAGAPGGGTPLPRPLLLDEDDDDAWRPLRDEPDAAVAGPLPGHEAAADEDPFAELAELEPPAFADSGEVGRPVDVAGRPWAGAPTDDPGAWQAHRDDAAGDGDAFDDQASDDWAADDWAADDWAADDWAADDQADDDQADDDQADDDEVHGDEVDGADQAAAGPGTGDRQRGRRRGGGKAAGRSAGRPAGRGPGRPPARPPVGPQARPQAHPQAHPQGRPQARGQGRGGRPSGAPRGGGAGRPSGAGRVVLWVASALAIILGSLLGLYLGTLFG